MLETIVVPFPLIFHLFAPPKITSNLLEFIKNLLSLVLKLARLSHSLILSANCLPQSTKLAFQHTTSLSTVILQIIITLGLCINVFAWLFLTCIDLYFLNSIKSIARVFSFLVYYFCTALSLVAILNP
jgi:hypothetical protein